MPQVTKITKNAVSLCLPSCFMIPLRLLKLRQPHRNHKKSATKSDDPTDGHSTMDSTAAQPLISPRSATTVKCIISVRGDVSPPGVGVTKEGRNIS